VLRARPDEPAATETMPAVLEAVRRYGYNATAFQVLEPGFQYWFTPDAACAVAYVDTGSAWVGAGAPLAPSEQLAAVAQQFANAAAARGRRVCFVAVEPRFLELAAPLGLQALQIGEQPVWNPQQWPEITASSRSLREQLRRARAKGVTISPLQPADLADAASPLRAQVEQLLRAWLSSRNMAPLGFLVQLHVFSYVAERRCFVARQHERVIGFLGMIPVYARGGWFIEDFLREPTAPNGTSELMIDAAMQAAAAEGATFATLGLSPLAGTVVPALQWLGRLGSAFYDFTGLRAFKAKLKPERWDPIYIAFQARSSGWLALYDMLKALARGNLLRFGIETILRGPAVVLRALSLFLIPWTLLMAAADSAHWFPSPWTKWAWVGFHLLLTAALLKLSSRWSEKLGLALAAAATCDAIATALEAISFNWPRAESWVDAVVIAVSMAAPVLAATVLWRARARHQLTHAFR
jgi:phosphatidylglycerol lysyltransferase